METIFKPVEAQTTSFEQLDEIVSRGGGRARAAASVMRRLELSIERGRATENFLAHIMSSICFHRIISDIRLPGIQFPIDHIVITSQDILCITTRSHRVRMENNGGRWSYDTGLEMKACPSPWEITDASGKALKELFPSYNIIELTLIGNDCPLPAEIPVRTCFQDNLSNQIKALIFQKTYDTDRIKHAVETISRLAKPSPKPDWYRIIEKSAPPDDLLRDPQIAYPDPTDEDGLMLYRNDKGRDQIATWWYAQARKYKRHKVHYNFLEEFTFNTGRVGIRLLNPSDGPGWRAFSNVMDRLGHVRKTRFNGNVMEKDQVSKCVVALRDAIRLEKIGAPDSEKSTQLDLI
jgi:hypothetical protein